LNSFNLENNYFITQKVILFTNIKGKLGKLFASNKFRTWRDLSFTATCLQNDKMNGAVSSSSSCCSRSLHYPWRFIGFLRISSEFTWIYDKDFPTQNGTQCNVKWIGEKWSKHCVPYTNIGVFVMDLFYMFVQRR